MRPLFLFPPSFCLLILLAPSSDASASHRRTPTERSWRRQRKQQQERASAATAAATAAAAASLEAELLASERWSIYAGGAHGATGSVGTLAPASPSYCNEIIPVTPETCRLLIQATTVGAAMVACTLLESCATPNDDDAGDGVSCVLGKARLTRLHPCLFSAMTAMHELAIYRNPHLLALPPGLLAPLTDLRALSIYSNGLGTGRQEGTARQDTGQHDTQGGQPRCAPERQPGEQPRQLELEDRQLGPIPTPPGRIPHDLLRGLTHLTSLRLHANRLSARDLPALRLPSLQALWLHSNHIEALPRGYLQDHIQDHIEEEEGRLQEEGRPQDESNSTLRLNASPTASIGSSLESLFLNKNRLRTLDGGTFRGLARLRFLWL